jgi:hypothetical protein
MAFRQHLIANRQIIEVEEERATDVSISMTLTPIHESIVVTASAGETTTFEAFNSISSYDSMDLAEKMAGTIGEVTSVSTSITP